MTIELNPCPFCGSKGAITETPPYKVYCTNVCCICFAPHLAFKHREEAVSAWNRRALNGAALSEDWLELIDTLTKDLNKVKALIKEGGDTHG